MRPVEGCAFFGAYRACIGISNAVILLHSVVGCNFGTLFFHLAQRPEDVRQASTVFYGEEALYGGTDSLVKALRNADALYQKAKVFIVLSGCVPNMVGDDVVAAIAAAEISRPVIHVTVPGTAGDMASGYESALLALARYMEPLKAVRQVNLLGLSADDFLVRGDMDVLREILAPQVRLETVAVDEPFEAFCRAGSAALNVAFGAGRALAEEMRSRFGIPYILARYPYGIHGMAAFLEKIAAALPNVSFQEAIQNMDAGVDAALGPMSFYLRLLYGMPTAILGDAARSEGLRVFLEEELGMDVALCHAGGQEDVADLYREMEERAVPLLFGSSFERGWCEEHQAALVRVFYPVFDEVVFSSRSFLGLNGFFTLTETIVNSLQRQTLQRKRLYEGIFFPVPEGDGA